MKEEKILPCDTLMEIFEGGKNVERSRTTKCQFYRKDL